MRGAFYTFSRFLSRVGHRGGDGTSAILCIPLLMCIFLFYPPEQQPIPPFSSAPCSKLCQFKSSVGLKVTNNGNIANKKCLSLSAKDQLMNLDLNKDQAVDALTALLLLKVS